MRTTDTNSLAINSEILSESPFTLGEAQYVLPKSELAISRSETFVRSLASDGRRDSTGAIIKLEVCRNEAGVLITSVAAFKRFLQRINRVEL